MGWLLRLLLLLLLATMLLRAGYRLLEGIIEGATGSGPRRGGVPTKGTHMVRDPVCGTFVVQSRALTAMRSGRSAWFCSEECRRQWQAGRS